jgi:uncharacterized protein
MQKFLPGRHLIDAFGNRGFRLGGVSHVGSILVAPSGIRALEIAEINALSPLLLDVLVAEKAEIDMLLIGCGPDIAALPKAVRERLVAEKLNFEVMSTNAAVRTYNVVVAEDRRVAAIMIAVSNG